MKMTKRVVSFNNKSGVGVVRDRRGRLTLLSNKRNGKNISKGTSVYVVNNLDKSIVR